MVHKSSPPQVEQIGHVTWVNGPVVHARGSRHIGMLDVVEVGPDHLVGEVIRLERDMLTLQVYEETSGLHPGAPIYGTGRPLSVELGPGLLKGIFDGIQRPLPVMQDRSGAFIRRGVRVTPLYHQQLWDFEPRVVAGDEVKAGAILGVVPETPLIEHRVMVPPDLAGTLTWIAPAGTYRLSETIARLRTPAGEEHELAMLQYWPVRRPRPYAKRLIPRAMLVTGQRVLDTFFPLAKGGAAAIPGGFGAGKTVIQRQIAKWSDADITIYVGCGERGNEMVDILHEFPHLVDPRSGASMMQRTILIANTSNMPVAAREASIYTGITLAEYYRDMGYHVAVMADSTSWWAEAMREISGRLEEMPAEAGYPAYLATRLAEFYERAGRVRTLSGEIGSVSIIGAISPPGGDFSEPVTQHTRRFVRCFWALDKDLAMAQHFPAVNWLVGYSEYIDNIAAWCREQGCDTWMSLREEALGILRRENHLQQIVKLVGPDALPEDQRLILDTARLLREGFLQQNAFSEADAYAGLEKQVRMLALILQFHERAERLVAKGCPIIVIRELPVVNRLIRMKTEYTNLQVHYMDEIAAALEAQFDELAMDYA